LGIVAGKNGQPFPRFVFKEDDMKKVFFYLYLVVLETAVLSLNVSKTEWGPEKGGFGYYLKFMTEKNFEYGYNGKGRFSYCFFFKRCGYGED